MNPFTMTGLELLQAMYDGRIPSASMGQVIPMHGTDMAPGLMRMATQADDRHLNPMGGVHGGFAATVLDSVTGCAVHTMLEAGVGYATVDLQIKMVRPVPKNTPLVAEGRLLNMSKSIAIAEGDLKTAEGKLLAHATCTCMIIRS